MFWYLVRVSVVYLLCEWAKRSPFVTMPTYHYENCLRIFEQEIQDDVARTVCDILNKQENFTEFVHALFLTNLVVYALVRDALVGAVRTWYWPLMAASSGVYILLGHVPLFQFSITSNTDYTPSRLAVLGGFVGPVLALALRQALRKQIRWRLFVPFLSLYLVSFLLFAFAAGPGAVAYHAHHVILCGALSLCFTAMADPIVQALHAILLGIVVQGLNFYSGPDMHLFHIPYTSAPSWPFISCVAWPGAAALLCIPVARDWCRRPRASSLELPLLLVPTADNMRQRW